jgi:tetrahydromethanopterin S-methyltransferase subunit B
MKKKLSLSELNNRIRQLDEAIKDYENSLTKEELLELKAELEQN